MPRYSEIKTKTRQTLDKVGEAVENIMSTERAAQPQVIKTSVKQTCLESFGIEARKEHLFRNEWKKDLQYSKALVDAEYSIQTEFKVSSYTEKLQEQYEADAQKKMEKERRKAEKQAAKKAKKEAKEALDNAKAASVQGGWPEDRCPEQKQVVPNESSLLGDSAAEYSVKIDMC